MRHIVLIAVGGSLGAVARYGLTGLVHKHFKGLFPLGTLAVNLAGCLLIGVIMGLVVQRQLFAPGTRIFLLVGFLSSFTTLSTVSYETFQFLHDTEIALALGNILANAIGGIVLVAVGWLAVRFVAGFGGMS